MLVYFDTSALLKLYVEEEGRELVREAAKKAERVTTSTVAYAEARAGLARRFREGDFTEEEHRAAVSDLNEDWQSYARLNVSGRISYRAGELAERHALRGFDAIHLASALRFAESFERLTFLAFDGDLTDAARAFSLPIYGDRTNVGHKADNDPGRS